MAKKAPRIAREARIASEKWRAYFRYNIDEYHRLMNFVLGRQWTEDETDDMVKTFKKVPLQFNKLATLVSSLLGEQQQNTPQFEVVPLSNCSEETASIRQMLVKDIILSTDAKLAYQVAAQQAFTGGFSAFLWDTEYANENSFDLVPKIRYFKDPARCYWDVGAEEQSKIDGMHCGYTQRITRAKFREMYGKDIEEKILGEFNITQSKEEIALAVQPTLTDDPFSWADDEGITLLHHYKRKFYNDTLYKLSNGENVNQEELDEIIENSRSMNEDFSGLMDGEPLDDMEEFPIEEGAIEKPSEKVSPITEKNEELELLTLYHDGMPVRIEEKRTRKKDKIMHYVCAGDYILEQSECPCEDLPMPFVDQNSYFDKSGKQVCRSFIIDAVDAQRYINYLGTQSAYILKISRYDQFIGSKKNVQSLDTQRNWRDPYTVQGMLTYDESESGAKPEQLRPPELSQSLTMQYERAINDLYTSTGLYPSRLGQEGNEVSGRAINARTRQGSYPTQVAFESIRRAVTAGGTIVNQMIPRVFDTQRVINLMMPDEGRKNIVINQSMDEYGEVIKNDMRKGTFEVRLVAGPSYEGQKQEALDSLNMILQANPQLLNLFADLYAENLPLVNTLEIKNRLKTIVPPQIIEAGKTGKMPQDMGQQEPTPEEQAMQADMQYKQQQIELKRRELEIKEQEAQASIEIEKMKLQIAEMELAGAIEEQKLRYLAETERTESDEAIAHADNLVKILTHKHI